MRRSVDTPRSVSDAYVTTFTTSPVCGASTTRPADDEVGNAGTVTFSVILDGKVLTSTSVLAGGSPSVTMDVSVASGQVLKLVVGDGGDGNANDHGDWANPVVTCT